MKIDSSNRFELQVFSVLARVRGATAATLYLFLCFKSVPTFAAFVKRLDRAVEKGLLAKSESPVGSVYRLTVKSTRLCNAPKAFAVAPSRNVILDMLSASFCAAQQSDFYFLLPGELTELCNAFDSSAVLPAQLPGRFVIRTIPIQNLATRTTVSEKHLHWWMADLKPVDQLLQRTQIVMDNLAKKCPLFGELAMAGIFGFTIAVPTESMRQSILSKTFPAEVSAFVVDDLKSFVMGEKPQI